MRKPKTVPRTRNSSDSTRPCRATHAAAPTAGGHPAPGPPRDAEETPASVPPARPRPACHAHRQRSEQATAPASCEPVEALTRVQLHHTPLSFALCVWAHRAQLHSTTTRRIHLWSSVLRSSGGSAPSEPGRGTAHGTVRGNARLPEGGDVRCASACASRCLGGRGGADAAGAAGRCRAGVGVGVGVGVEQRALALEGTQPNHISISISISISTRLARTILHMPLVLTYDGLLGGEHEAAVRTCRSFLVDWHVP